ncbi:MAG: IclR family transcriptional regulator [Syntrophorhabdaceae bacterium]|nr:IclR family transcriptional regulator [Syntrophorhabdaceae bacterium]
MNDYNAPIIKKAIDIIVLIGKENRPLGVSEISKTLGYSKSTTFGILKALSDIGFLTKDQGTKRYAIGKNLLRLSKIIYKNQDILFVIRPYLEELASQVDETVFFGVHEGDSAKILLVIEARKSLKISSPVGIKLPITAGAAGKVLLSALKNDEIRKILEKKGLPKYTENSIVDVDRFIEEIEKTRRLGYGLDLEEYLKGVRAVAGPVYQDERMVGAIWIVGFSNTMTDDKLPVIIEQMNDMLRRIKKRISFIPRLDEEEM